MTNPSIFKQKTFIIENEHILNQKIRLDILNRVMLDDPKVLMEMAGTKELMINLDMCKDEIICSIYNIVKSRLDTLNQPVGTV
jgi:hypothetical protein